MHILNCDYIIFKCDFCVINASKNPGLSSMDFFFFWWNWASK